MAVLGKKNLEIQGSSGVGWSLAEGAATQVRGSSLGCGTQVAKTEEEGTRQGEQPVEGSPATVLGQGWTITKACVQCSKLSKVRVQGAMKKHYHMRSQKYAAAAACWGDQWY